MNCGFRRSRWHRGIIFEYRPVKLTGIPSHGAVSPKYTRTEAASSGWTAKNGESTHCLDPIGIVVLTVG